MAKGKYKQWLEPEKLTLLQGWARDGLTDEQIAHNMGISPATLYNWKRDHLEILEVLKKGKEVIDFEVENVLLMKALSGDVTAIIFWLKNRRPDKWREKPPERGTEQMEDDPLTVSIEEAVKNGVIREAVSDIDVPENKISGADL